MSADLIRCDNYGCDETYPLHHENEGDPGFEDGKWLGWFYLDLNRPDLIARGLRFCDIRCLRWWLDATTQANKSPQRPGIYDPTPRVLDEVAIRRRGTQVPS